MADWREELKNAYDKSADEKVKQSDAVYQKKMAQVLGDALSRGLGRSSYAAATQANLLNDMNEAGNQIRTDFRLEYLKALQQRELEEAQLAENRRQFDLRYGGMGAGGGGGYGGSSYNPGNNNPGDDENKKDRYNQLQVGLNAGYLQGINNALNAAVGVERNIAHGINSGINKTLKNVRTAR